MTISARLAAWHAAIALGEADVARGDVIPYTPEVLEEITRTALAEMHSDRPIDPDVLP